MFACLLLQCPRNSNFGKLGAGYLFPVVAKKRREYAAAHPDAKVTMSAALNKTANPCHLLQLIRRSPRGMRHPGHRNVDGHGGCCVTRVFCLCSPFLLREGAMKT